MKNKTIAITIVTLCAATLSNAVAKETSSAFNNIYVESFIKDSKLKLSLRNMYFDRDNREADKYAGTAQEWGQAALLEYNSGYTGGQVGLGVDVLTKSSIRLSGNGRRGAPNEERNPGQIFPVKKYTGRAVPDFNAVDVIGKAKFSKSDIKVGNGFRPRLPVVMSSDSRLLPQSFSGMMISSKEIEKLHINAGNLKRVRGRVSANWNKIAIQGAEKGSSNLYFAGADYTPQKDLLLQYYLANLENFYIQNFVGLQYKTPDSKYGRLKFDTRYFYSTGEGQNKKHNSGYSSRGYYGNGITKGEVDNQLAILKLNYELSGHDFGIGYQHSSGKSDFPHTNNSSAYSGDSGSTAYIITQMYNQNFTRAGERSLVATYSYDFAKIGVDGLTAGWAVAHGNHIKTSNGKASERENNFFASYTFQEGNFKGLSFLYKHSIHRSQIQDGVDDNFFIINYSYELL